MRILSLGIALAALLRTGLAANCACGYTINSTSPGHGALFTDVLENDFTRSDAVTWSSEQGVPWQCQQYNTTATAARGPYGKAARLSNVVADAGGLHLWVRSDLVDDGSGGQLVPMAEVVSARSDLLYGSFRVGMKTTGINGTCGAFFLYHSDSEEIDMEILSRQENASAHFINLVNQSPQSVASGYNAVNTSDFVVYPLPFDPTAGVADYRFDWLPDRIDMYANGRWMDSFYDSIPSDPGALHLIHWSNGDPGWSGGPPVQDAVLTILYVEAYFNTTGPPSTASRSGVCSDVCELPSTGSRPSASASGTASAPSSTGGAKHGAGSRIEAMSALLLAVATLLLWAVAVYSQLI